MICIPMVMVIRIIRSDGSLIEVRATGCLSRGALKGDLTCCVLYKISMMLGKLPPCLGRAKLGASPAVDANKSVKDHLSFGQTVETE